MEFNKLYPELIVSNIDRSLHFYRDVLGFSVEYERPEEKFAFLTFEGSQLMLLQDNESPHSRTGALEYPRGQGVNFSMSTSDLAPLARALGASRHPLRIPIREQWHRQDDVLHGEKQLWVMDPDGYLLRFIQNIGTRPVEDACVSATGAPRRR